MKKGLIRCKTATNILMIGNGFDINNQLPTKYSNFIHVVDCLSRLISDDQPILSVGQVFSNSALQEADKDIKTITTVYRGKYDEDLNPDEIKEAFGDAGNNEWFQYFMKQSLHDGGWVDFEQEIKKVIKHISYALDKLIEETTDGVYLHFRPEKDVYVEYVCNQFSFFFEKEEQQSAFKICESVSAEITKRHMILAAFIEKPLSKGFAYRLKKTKIVDSLYGKLKTLSHMLRDYLKWFVDGPVENLRSSGMIGDELLKTWPWLATQVISFNYTHTLQQLYGSNDFPKTHYIHGAIGEDSEIVLGVDSDEQDELEGLDTTFVEFKKYYQRANYGTDTSYLKYIYYNSLSSSYDLFVLGHSLDYTDREVIHETFERAKRIFIFYHNDNAKENRIRNLIGIFGKEGFERLRKKKMLCFVSQNNLDSDWSTLQLALSDYLS